MFTNHSTLCLLTWSEERVIKCKSGLILLVIPNMISWRQEQITDYSITRTWRWISYMFVFDCTCVLFFSFPYLVFSKSKWWEGLMSDIMTSTNYRREIGERPLVVMERRPIFLEACSLHRWRKESGICWRRESTTNSKEASSNRNVGQACLEERSRLAGAANSNRKRKRECERTPILRRKSIHELPFLWHAEVSTRYLPGCAGLRQTRSCAEVWRQ